MIGEMHLLLVTLARGWRARVPESWIPRAPDKADAGMTETELYARP
jgi:hypothetical protein